MLKAIKSHHCMQDATTNRKDIMMFYCSGQLKLNNVQHCIVLSDWMMVTNKLGECRRMS
jgi:hypothetical protein